MARTTRSVFSDLNVGIQESRTANLALLQTLADIGYERVALCHHVTLRKGVQLKVAPALAELVERIPSTKRGRQLEVLQRLNITVDDPALLHTLSSPAAESYDLLSVCPASAKVFLQSWSTLPIDIVSFNFTEKLPFPLKFAQLYQAVKRGLSLEICYSPALRGSSGRRNTLSNAQDLVKGCKGKSVLVSSGGEKPLDLRPPLDVANMSRLFGLTDIQCKGAITTSSRTAILHAKMRSSSTKAVVSSLPLPVGGRRKREREQDTETLVKKLRES